jgi:hypothetical protein
MGVEGLNQNRKVKYKEEKFRREKLKREAARDVKARERAKMFGIEYIPEKMLTEEEIKKKKEDAKEKLKAERKVSRAKKAVLEEEKATAKAQRLSEKLARREQKKESKRKTAEAIAARKAIEAVEAADDAAKKLLALKDVAVDKFAVGADEIKLGINVDGRVRRIPGVGKVEKYPSKKEKLRTKIESRAFEAGITYEEMEARMRTEQEEKMAPEMQRVAQLRTQRGGLTARQWHRYCSLAETESQEEAEKYFLQTKKKNDGKAAAEAKSHTNGHTSSGDSESGVQRRTAIGTSAIPITNGTTLSTAINGNKEPKVKPISEKKMKKYAAKAAEKGITVEAYIAKKKAKKSKDDNSSDEVHATAGAPTPAPASKSTPFQLSGGLPGGKSRADLLLAAAKSEILTNGNTPGIGTDGFVVDTSGDPTLNLTADPTPQVPFIIDPSGDPDILTRSKPVLVWHPDMQGERKVKDLSKEERRARLHYMRERRAAKHAAEGKTPLSKKERNKARMEKKQKHRNKLVANIMMEKGKPKDEVTQEELEEARRAAKKVMREEKRVKRDKVIHRKKLGGGLRGQFGGSISVG